MPFFPWRSPSKGRWIFSPFYLLIIWGLFALLLLISGTYEAKRTKDILYGMLSDEGSALIEGLEKSAQNIFTSLTTLEALPEASALMISSPINLLDLEESVIDYLVEIAFQIDQKLGKGPLAEKEIEAIGKGESLAGLEVITPSKHFVYRRQPAKETLKGRYPFYQSILEGKASYAIHRLEKKTTGQIDHLAIAVRRKAGEGILVLEANESGMKHLRLKVVLQGVIEDWRGKGEIQYITFQGKNAEVWADTDPQKIGQQEEKAFLQQLLDHPASAKRGLTRKLSGIFEAAKIVTLGREQQSILRVGLSTARVEQILQSNQRNIVLFELLLLVFGGVGITFIYRMENRHLARMREMEEKVRQSEKLSSLANLAAGVAHEIRNPLNAIGLAIQRLQREFSPQDPGMQREYFQFTDVLRGEVKRVNEIIEQFLFFARPAKLELQDVAIQEILNHLLLLAQEVAQQQQVTLERNIDPNLPPLRLDRQRMQEALWNLITNALQAMPDGGRLQVSAQLVPGKRVLIEVADTGKGIPEENLIKIFDYYFTTKEKGVGLGLPLAHKIIQEHGGSIEVRSLLGKGTVFQVSIPAERA